MSLGNIGTLFASLGDVERGLEYFERALAIAIETSNTEDSGSHLCNIGNVYRKLEDYPRALEYFHRALTIFEKAGDRRRTSALLGNIGTVCFYCGDFDEALRYVKNALQVAEELGDTYGIALWRTNIGELYSTQSWHQFNLKKAEEYLLGVLVVQEKAGAMVDQYWIHKILGNVYKQQERWKDAFYHSEKFHELKDEYHNISTVKSVTDSDSKRKIAIISKEKEITDAKNAELEIANKLKTKLLGIAAHDLKNPLGNIIGFVKMLLEETPTESEHHEMLTMINESSQNMLKLIGDLLESSAAEIGAMTLELDTIDAAEILRTVIYSNISSAQVKKQRIESTIENLNIIADSKRLRQVVENLVGNAIKYSHSDKNITIRLFRNNTNARIEVQDEGQGLTQDDLSKLFGQFQRLSAQPTGGETATGLGLSIVKQIVELHGGRIWAESEGKNKGATFIVELPLAD
ncbi:MAG: tetratricopeptide repeat-containing sensor histidine kinase [Ignavibacteriae bacterium]|nr:tetratricopeptide repeat-containing sensor histidine kinase [Ignavibacteriota bacterium]